VPAEMIEDAVDVTTSTSEPNPREDLSPWRLKRVSLVDAPGATEEVVVRDNGESVLVGRGPSCQLLLTWRQQKLASREHAELFVGPNGELFVIDLNSMNGVVVNGVVIDANVPRQLYRDDVVSFGGRRLTAPRARSSSGIIENLLREQPFSYKVFRSQNADATVESTINGQNFAAQENQDLVQNEALNHNHNYNNVGVGRVNVNLAGRRGHWSRRDQTSLRTSGGRNDEVEDAIDLVSSGSSVGSDAGDEVVTQPSANAITVALAHKLADFEGMLECVLCLELMEKPVVLTCSHSFCESCWQEWVERQELNKAQKAPAQRKRRALPKLKTAECPTCREMVPVKAPVALLLQNVIAGIKAANEKALEEGVDLTSIGFAGKNSRNEDCEATSKSGAKSLDLNESGNGSDQNDDDNSSNGDEDDESDDSEESIGSNMAAESANETGQQTVNNGQSNNSHNKRANKRKREPDVADTQDSDSLLKFRRTVVRMPRPRFVEQYNRSSSGHANSAISEDGETGYATPELLSGYIVSLQMLRRHLECVEVDAHACKIFGQPAWIVSRCDSDSESWAQGLRMYDVLMEINDVHCSGSRDNAGFGSAISRCCGDDDKDSNITVKVCRGLIDISLPSESSSSSSSSLSSSPSPASSISHETQ